MPCISLLLVRTRFVPGIGAVDRGLTSPQGAEQRATSSSGRWATLHLPTHYGYRALGSVVSFRSGLPRGCWGVLRRDGGATHDSDGDDAMGQ